MRFFKNSLCWNNLILELRELKIFQLKFGFCDAKYYILLLRKNEKKSKKYGWGTKFRMRSIFRNFKITNVKIAKDKLFMNLFCIIIF